MYTVSRKCFEILEHNKQSSLLRGGNRGWNWFVYFEKYDSADGGLYGGLMTLETVEVREVIGSQE